MAKAGMKGFKVTHKHCLISNLKKVFVELSKSETMQEQIGVAMMFAPATMLTA